MQVTPARRRTKLQQLQTAQARLLSEGVPLEQLRPTARLSRGASPGISTIPRPISAPISDLSIALFLNQFSVSSAAQPLGRLEFIPDIYQEYERRPESCLISVIDAFAHACLASQNGMVFDPKILARKYGKALQAMKQALADPAESRQDGTIVAVWLLCWYEVGSYMPTVVE